VARLPVPDLEAPVRLWVDRCFTIRGAGTVVTGTLGAGRLKGGDELELAGGRRVRVRGLQSLGAPVSQADAVARVAVNLRGVERDQVGRGDALVTPGRFHLTDVADVRLAGDPVADLPSTLTLHVGSAAVTVRVRPLGKDTARLRMDTALPLRIGDRVLLRDPGRHHVAGGVTVLDVSPPPLRRRGAATLRAQELSTMDGKPSMVDELRRRALIRRTDLERMGVTVTASPVAGDWLADPDHWSALRGRLVDEATRYAREHPLEQGAPVEALRHGLDLPDRVLVDALVAPPLVAREGRIGVAGQGSELPELVARAVERVRLDLAGQPFHAPEAARLAQLGLGSRELAAAVRAGALLRVADGVVLLPGAIEEAVAILARLPQPFTLSDARQALGTTRRVAVPMLELLDRRGATRRLPDDRRVIAS
jgi:selenocysteine-specific elongation factor